MTSLEENKALVRQAIGRLWNEGCPEAVDEFLAPAFIDHQPTPGPPQTLDDIKQELRMYRTAFPDLHITIEDQIAEGDRVVSRWTARATHRGPLWGVPATGRSVAVMGVFIDRLADGKIQEEWAHWDRLGLLQQLGVVKAPATESPAVQANPAG